MGARSPAEGPVALGELGPSLGPRPSRCCDARRRSGTWFFCRVAYGGPPRGSTDPPRAATFARAPGRNVRPRPPAAIRDKCASGGTSSLPSRARDGRRNQMSVVALCPTGISDRCIFRRRFVRMLADYRPPESHLSQTGRAPAQSLLTSAATALIPAPAVPRSPRRSRRPCDTPRDRTRCGRATRRRAGGAGGDP